MAATYVEAIRRVQPRGPYHLGGWSLGGMIAFEMGRQLTDLGESVASVAIIDILAYVAASRIASQRRSQGWATRSPASTSSATPATTLARMPSSWASSPRSWARRPAAT